MRATTRSAFTVLYELFSEAALIRVGATYLPCWIRIDSTRQGQAWKNCSPTTQVTANNVDGRIRIADMRWWKAQRALLAGLWQRRDRRTEGSAVVLRTGPIKPEQSRNADRSLTPQSVSRILPNPAHKSLEVAKSAEEILSETLCNPLWAWLGHFEQWQQHNRLTSGPLRRVFHLQGTSQPTFSCQWASLCTSNPS